MELIFENDYYVWFTKYDKAVAAKAYSRGFKFAERFTDSRDIMYLKKLPKKTGRFRFTDLYKVTNEGVLLNTK